MLKIHKLNQEGVTSILSVVVFATIVTVLVTAYLATVISQQNEANNYDQGTRAFYAAESGVQDAVRALNSDNTLAQAGQNTCQRLVNGGNAGVDSSPGDLGGKAGVGYTCQLIAIEQDSLKGVAGDFTNVTFRLSPKNASASDRYQLRLSWSTKSSQVLEGRTDNKKLFPQYGNWFNTRAGGNIARHPIVKANLISMPVTGLSRAAIVQDVLYLNPVNGSVPATDLNSSPGQQDEKTLVNNARCYPTSGSPQYDSNYYCQAVINLNKYDFNSKAVYLRVHTIYGGAATGFSASLFKAGSAVNEKLLNSQAAIDVTGKSGRLYKRVKQTVPIGGGNTTDTIPDAALVAGDGICKLFTIGTVDQQYQYDCSPTN